MSFNHQEVHDWAQKALDKYNGGYTASTINLNATTYLYELRDNGNADNALAVASHYLHCRYVSSKAYLVGAIAGFLAVMTYDGAVKFIATLIKEYSSKELVHKFGKSPTSSFSTEMIAWDLQGLSDGTGDFMFQWGNTTLYAAQQPRASLYPQKEILVSLAD